MRLLLFFFLAPLILHAQISYEGSQGPGKGKHIVFVASDHEYRSEQTCPALARILAERQGFKTTVLFGVDKNGHIEAGSSNIKGLEALKDADLMVLFTRFLDLPDEQMQHIVDYLDRGGPVVGLRTASHAFKIPNGKTFSRFDFKYGGKEFEKGFGHQILGNTWVGHYGRNHQQGTRIQLIPAQKNNPILRGVGDGAFCYAGGYNGIAGDDFTVLANSQPLVSMKKDAALDKSKAPVPCTWTRHYTTKDGKKARVFHTTQGASQDILDPDYRRLVLNGIFWAVGLENKIDGNANIDFVGAYKPTTFNMGGHVKNVKPADLQDIKSPIMPEPKAPKKDAKHTRLDGPKAKRDPKLAQYYINQKSSPKPKAATPVETKLPLEVAPKSRIAFVGNLLLDNERRYGHLETLIHQHLPKHELEVRNFAWPADEIDIMPRPENFGTLDQHLLYYKTDIIIAAFGYNESFAGADGLDAFKQRLEKFLKHLKSHAYNGKTAPQIVLLSPTPNEDTEQVIAAEMNNKNIALYTQAMKEIAASNKIAFIDSSKGELTKAENYTSDGNSLTEKGHALFAKDTSKALFGKEAPAINEAVRTLVIDKAEQFFYRYRPLNTFYYVGGRSDSYGYLDFLPAMRNFDQMVENRFKAIHATAAGTPSKPDDSNLPKMDDVLLAIGANEFMSPENELKAFKIDPRFEVNCFASEKDFPELACPISIRWDAKGRLWVSCSTAYPHLYPGQKPADKIIILEDTDKDGKADKCTTYADDLHIPLSFVLDGEGGVYCSEQPHLTYLKDTDGDDKADTREIIYTGFGCEDSHHSLHDFAWTPGGDLLFRESVFHRTQLETPYGPVRTTNSSWFLYQRSNKKLTAFGSYPNTNPWGISFDKWGNHVASHPVFASSFHATNPPYPVHNYSTASGGFGHEAGQHPPAKDMQAYSGVCGHDFVDFPFWPKEMQGGFVKNRYKPTNNVEFHTWTEKDDHFAEEKKFDLIFSTNLSFIPVDLKFGPSGAMYICDWYNPVKGHAQYSLRDPRRDRKAGRIWRVIPKNAKLADAPKIEDATVVELLNHLKSGQNRVRNWARRELRTRDKNEVLNALNTWTVRNSKDQHALLEALWVYQGIGKKKTDLLRILIHSDNHLIAAAAFGPLRFWAEDMPTEKVAELLKYGSEHPSQHVRREAVICASYIGTQEAFDAVQPVLAQPAGPHLSYAVRTSFESKDLRPYWTKETAGKLKSLGQQKEKAKDTRTAEEKAFDQQKNLQTVKLGCVPERIQFDTGTLKVKADAPVKFIFNNPDATQHNVLILEQGTPIQDIGMAANEMAKDANGAKKHYVPEDKRILHHSRLLDPHSSQTLRFIAPKKPGKYPFVCTFPGHWTVMKGDLIVE